MCRLRCGPAREFAVLKLGYCARGTDRAMGMNRKIVGCAELARRCGEGGCGIPGVARDVVLEDLRAADIVPDPGLLRQAVPTRPLHGQLPRGLDSAPLAPGDDPEEILDTHDLHNIRDVADSAFVITDERRAERRRHDDPAMQHARSLEVLHEGEPTRYLVRDVEAGNWFADQLEVCRRFKWCALVKLE